MTTTPLTALAQASQPRPKLAARSLLLTVLGLVCALAGLQGCTASPWERNFVATAQGAALAKDAPVQVREVAWDRLQVGVKEIEGQEAKSDVHPADWSAEKKAQVKGQLLKTLQVSEDPASVTVIGRTDFRTTTLLRPESAEQREIVGFARKIGATRVLWSRRLVGQADTIVQEPVVTYSTGGGWGRRRGGGFAESYTTWVPIAVRADEYAYVAYFLRTGAP